MNDKEELKNDEIVESGNKSDEKLVSRAPEPKRTTYHIINNTEKDAHCIYFKYPTTTTEQTISGGNTYIIYSRSSGDIITISPEISGEVISVDIVVNNITIEQYSNEDSITLVASNYNDVVYVYITAIQNPPKVIEFYLNESYSVPNFVDPEPKLLAVRNNNTNSIDDLLFSDSSYNLITPIAKETITSGYQYLFTFKENDNVSKIWTNRRDTGADHRSNLYYENIDFTGSSQSSLTFEYKTYNNIKYDIAPILDGYKSMIINWLY